jgi:hypothetical protein
MALRLALAIVVRCWSGDYRFRLDAPVRLESELKMNFGSSTDVVCITSDEGDAVVPGTEARAVAEQEANTSGRPVTIRNPVTDKVLATIRPASVERTAKGAGARRGDDAMPRLVAR